MPEPLLALLKLVLLALLYLFVARTVGVVRAEIYGTKSRRKAAPPRPAKSQPPAPAAKSKKSPKDLVVHPPDGQPSVIKLTGSAVTLGRSDRVTVMIDDSYMSEEHAVIAPSEDGIWMVRDLGSTNGTFLNGAKVTSPAEIGAGDQIRLGKTGIEVRR